jgi:hypothetical protein
LLVRKWPGTTLRCSTSTGADDVIDGMPTRKLRFAGDSPLEGDGFEPSVPRKEPHANAFKRRCSAPVCGVAHDDRDADRVRDRRLCAGRSRRRPGRRARMHGCPVAPLNSPIGVVASIAAWTARETQHSDARLRVNRRLPTLTPPRFGAKRLEQRRDWRISENMIGVRS